MEPIENIKVTTYEEQVLRDMYNAVGERIMQKNSNNINKAKRIRNAYKGAEVSHLTRTWNRTNASGDTEIRGGLSMLRAGARERSRNDEYAKRFLRMVVINIMGAKGITFQSKVKQKSGAKLDNAANTRIEKDFKDWGKKKNSPEVTGKLSWRGIQKAILKTVARDGEILIRKVKAFRNKYRYSLQLLEGDVLDETYNATLPSGNEIRMGIELDEWKRVVAYWILVKHPGDYSFPNNVGRFKRKRIDASEIIHIYDPDRVNDTRGITWMHASMFSMRMLAGYEEAELVSARTAAIKSAQYISPDGDPSVGKEEIENGDYASDAVPGAFDVSPEGYKLEPLQWDHPAGNFPPFVNQVSRRMAAGFGVSFHGLTGNLEKVNFSSIRSGTLEERDNWTEHQETFIEDVCTPVYQGWLEMWLLMPRNPYTPMDYDRLDASKWIPRTWAWVDPKKDVEAAILGLEAGLITYEEILAERGKDFQEHVVRLVAERKALKEAGLSFDTSNSEGKIKDSNDESEDDEENLDEKEDEKETVKARSNGNGRKF